MILRKYKATHFYNQLVACRLALWQRTMINNVEINKNRYIIARKTEIIVLVCFFIPVSFVNLLVSCFCSV